MTPALFTCLWFALGPDPAAHGTRRRWRIMCIVWLAHVLTALTYWLGADLPRARTLDQKWPAARRLADQITADRDRVVIDASLRDLGLLLDLQLDRRVTEHSGDAPIRNSAEWVIIPTEQKPPPGFVPRSSVGGCELLQRD